jgi:hypothetical protein
MLFDKFLYLLSLMFDILILRFFLYKINRIIEVRDIGLLMNGWILMILSIFGMRNRNHVSNSMYYFNLL